MTRLFAVSVLAIAALANSAQAGLLGTTVTGSATFGGGSTDFFDPVNGLVPLSCLNTSGTSVTIANPATEFCFEDDSNAFTVQFTDAMLTITNNSFDGSLDWTMTFLFNPGLVTGISEISDNYPDGGLSSSLVGDLLTVDFGGTGTPGTYNATFQIDTAAAVPEPSTIPLLGAGLVAVGAYRRFRR